MSYEIVFKGGQHHVYIKGLAVRIATFAPGVGKPDMDALVNGVPITRPEAAFALPWSPEETARRFHDAYELFAPAFGWATQENSRKPWDELPPSIRNLMIAVVRNVLIEQTQSPPP